jgi:L-seryl-tRNA(Ser) seleniumtransferase
VSAVEERLRALPSVGRLASELCDDATALTLAEATAIARDVLNDRRREVLAGADDAPDPLERASRHAQPSMRRVLNATGVVIHTNLGRAPLPVAAVEAIRATADGYTNLEMELGAASRRSRDEHVRGALRELTGAEDALVVNNGAGAVLLAVAALGEDRTVIVRAASSSRSGAAFGSQTSSRKRASRWSRWAPRIARASLTTNAPWRSAIEG